MVGSSQLSKQAFYCEALTENTSTLLFGGVYTYFCLYAETQVTDVAATVPEIY